jgi:hypothetical protein
LTGSALKQTNHRTAPSLLHWRVRWMWLML